MRTAFTLPAATLKTATLLATMGCLALLAATPARAQNRADAEICAASDDSATSPEQRIAACTTVIMAATDDTMLVDALVNRANVYFYRVLMKAAFADLNRALGIDPANAA